MIYPMNFIDEEYKFITQDMIPNVDKDRYLVSSYGAIFDTKRGIQLEQYNCNGYLMTWFHLEITGYKSMLCHRLVAMAFVKGDWSLQVNHIDGNKRNNYYKNLEWVTARENLIHAIELGLNYRGEDKPNSILKNDQVHEICRYLELGYDYNSIVDIMNLDYIPNIHNILHDIKCGKSWTFISKNYNIPTYKIVNNRYLSNDQAIIICNAIRQNPNISNKELFNIAGLDVSDSNKYSKARHVIESIKCRKAYTDISDKYLFGKGSTTSPV